MTRESELTPSRPAAPDAAMPAPDTAMPAPDAAMPAPDTAASAPSAPTGAAPRVLLLEQQSALRGTLRDLLRRRGIDVTAQAPGGIPPGADLFESPCPWDAVVFNATQRPVRRKRWLFGYRPARGQTRLVALCDQDPLPPYERHEVDAALPYPLSVSALVNAILGEEQPRSSSGARALLRSPR